MVIYPIDAIDGGSSSSSRRVGESLGLESWVGGVVESWFGPTGGRI